MSSKAMIFGYFLGDGWLDIKNNCGASGDKESLYLLASDIDKIYGDGTARRIYTRKTCSPKYGILGTTNYFVTRWLFSKEMKALGMPMGKRCSIDYKIPNWIMNGSIDTKRDFLSGYYAAEGLIPSLQSNKKTPRPLSFPFSKDVELLDSSRELANQFKSIIEDLGLSVTITELYVTTNKPKVKQIIDINNSEDDFYKALQLLDLKYCIKKEIRRKYLLIYFTMKRAERERILSIHRKIIEEKQQGATYEKLACKYNLSSPQVEGIMNGRSHAKQVRGFPKFDQNFIETYCLSKTPLNDETLSDFPADNDVPSLER